MASIILLFSELLRPNSSSVPCLSSHQPFPPSSATFSPSISQNTLSLNTTAARKPMVGNNNEEVEAAVYVVEDLQEPKVCVDLVWL
ncbi:hypothetical protein SAY86_021742 [Trapa natans]|uniref:Uncharacterized protein n=1 Tax=Trapa natans TaxID=22666 RepID=A0AAN7M8J3_TRANT|nr:hypothetical protein SAY86_021742 [Trapa natans]